MLKRFLVAVVLGALLSTSASDVYAQKKPRGSNTTRATKSKGTKTDSKQSSKKETKSSDSESSADKADKSDSKKKSDASEHDDKSETESKSKATSEKGGSDDSLTISKASDTKKTIGQFSKAIEAITPAIVSLRVNRSHATKHSPSGNAHATAVVLTNDGWLVTSARAIEGATVEVRTKDGGWARASVKGHDNMTDLALLKVDQSYSTVARFAASSTQAGEWVIRAHQGSTERMVSIGSVASSGYTGLGATRADDLLRINATPTNTSAGSAVVNEDGDLVGVTVHPSAKTSAETVAVPAALVAKVVDQLKSKGRVSRAVHGISSQELSSDLASELGLGSGSGVLVSAVHTDSPASKANLRPADVVISVGSASVRSVAALERELLNHNAGEGVALEVIRSGKRYATKMVMGSSHESKSSDHDAKKETHEHKDFGLGVRDVTAADAKKKGLGSHALCVVSKVRPDSLAEASGLKVGDIVLEADGKTHPSASWVEEAAEDKHILLRIKRGETISYIALKR